MNNVIGQSKVDTYRQKKNKEEMKHQLISFALMIFFTGIAFTMVAMDMTLVVVAPILLLLAVIQVVFQLYYFMHMKEKGHGFVSLFLYSGVFVACLTVLAFTTIIWW